MKGVGMLLHVLLLGFLAMSLGSFIHEFGHYLAARMLGIPVLKFKLGVGPEIVRFRFGKTEYALGLLPMAGYIMTPGDDCEATPSEIREMDAFLARNPDLKSVVDDPACKSENLHAGFDVMVYAAGPLANLATAAILFYGATYISPRGEALYNDVVEKVCDKRTYTQTASSPVKSAAVEKKGQVLGFEVKEFFAAVFLYASCVLGFSQLLPIEGSDGNGVICGLCAVAIPPSKRADAKKKIGKVLGFVTCILLAFVSGLALGWIVIR
jgi:membrane-associated protease RseP (regulator of RpoE activity)